MTTFNEKLTTQWKDAGSLLLGIWLAVSPRALAGTIANLARKGVLDPCELRDQALQRCGCPC